MSEEMDTVLLGRARDASQRFTGEDIYNRAGH